MERKKKPVNARNGAFVEKEFEIPGEAIRTFFRILVVSIPFLVFGVVVSSLIAVFVKRGIIEKALGDGFFKSTAAALLLAFIVPVCETGEVPVARSLLNGGAPPGPVVTYILAASSFNPLVIAMTAIAFSGRTEIVWLRIAVTLVIAVTGGLVFRLLGNGFSIKEELPSSPFSWAGEIQRARSGPVEDRGDDKERTGKENRISEKLLIALEVARDELFYLLRFLIFGAAVAAFVRLFVSQKQVLGLTDGTVLSIISLMLLGVLLSLNSNIDSSYIAALPGVYAGGAVLGFLVAGSMMDLKSGVMLLSVFKARAVALLAALVLILTFVFCLISEYIFF